MIGFYSAGAMGQGGSSDSFPSYLSITPTDASAAASTPKAVSYPATVNAGDLLILIVAWSSNSISTPSGWTLLINASAPNAHSAAFYKVASGTEGGTTFSVGWSGSARAQFQVVRIAAGTFGGIESATGNGLGVPSASVPAPSLSPSWGSAKTLWIAAMCCQNTQAISAYPLPDHQIRTVSAGSPSGQWRTLASCAGEDETASKSPGNFTLGASSIWSAITIAVEPA